MFTQEDILNNEFFLVFKCVYYEDGIYPEYIFSGAFVNYDDAENHLRSINNGYYKASNKMFKQKIDFTSDTEKLFWNQEHDAWTDKGCFMSVRLNDMLNYLNA